MKKIYEKPDVLLHQAVMFEAKISTPPGHGGTIPGTGGHTPPFDGTPGNK